MTEERKRACLPPTVVIGGQRGRKREWQKGPRGHDENIHDQRE